MGFAINITVKTTQDDSSLKAAVSAAVASVVGGNPTVNMSIIDNRRPPNQIESGRRSDTQFTILR